jgi:hypothetical protein
MKQLSFFIGKTPFEPGTPRVKGGYVMLDGEPFYKISDVDAMPPFFMSLVSDSDHWMFISSNGALTAGRKNPDSALFPYYTDDRIHDSADITGAKTILFVTAGTKTFLWEPLSPRFEGLYRIERNLYKNRIGNKIMFEEINRDLSVSFRYAWMMSERYGFVRHSKIVNMERPAVSVRILDGIQNLLPHGVTRRFQLEYSTLADGYKKNELQTDAGLGIFTLSSIPTDKAEPSEALMATTVWSCGLKNAVRLISSRQVDRFRKGLSVKQETDVRAARGAYFMNAEFHLSGGSEKEWYQAADVERDASAVSALTGLLKKESDLKRLLLEDVKTGSENLIRIVASADGLQLGGDPLASSRHFSNVLFNVMRGGVPDDGYTVRRSDFETYLLAANRDVAGRRQNSRCALPERINRDELFSMAASCLDPDMERLALQYLPLTFSRRHGDPSRPWNLFSIEVKDGYGGKIFNYQGNWRDIFQNWEALALSYPEYAEGMIAKFVNASTADGYNPYRVTRDGFEWEAPDPRDPWSHIGYWGDHQIIYLLKLLEISARFHPGRIQDILARNDFAYSNVPYRIKPYEDLLRDPRNTIDFDADLDCEIEKRVRKTGTDGKFIRNRDGGVLHVNLAEKLLVPVLAKLSNFIPEAGIWMNTQRPEWNDANNALVGFGVSMVTVCHMRRYLAFCLHLFTSPGKSSFLVSEEVADLLASIVRTLKTHLSILDGSVSDANRKALMDGFGEAGGVYRQRIYSDGFSAKKKDVSAAELSEFVDLSLRYMDHSIRANRRKDGLYHAYNVIRIEDGSVSIRRLVEMLEGQVAALSSGLLSAEECLDVLDALRRSALYRKDQSSYILYPDRQLPRFVDKNNIPIEELVRSKLLNQLLESGDRRIVMRDSEGGVHFNGDFRNASILKSALERLEGDGIRNWVEKETPLILDIYERMFDHQSFTGRSGTFYKYEGLGCIYWHMVSKLLLAVQEAFFRARADGADRGILKRISDHYRSIREGIGVHKPPDRYGAFPTDPYSHTPGFAGVQQPGMTGQVKEDILVRFGELGIWIENGCIAFRPELIEKKEYLKQPGTFEYMEMDGTRRSLDLPRNSLAFTFCQVPVVYHTARDSKILIRKMDGSTAQVRSLSLDRETSASIFKRTGEISRLEVFLTPGFD